MPDFVTQEMSLENISQVDGWGVSGPGNIDYVQTITPAEMDISGPVQVTVNLGRTQSLQPDPVVVARLEGINNDLDVELASKVLPLKNPPFVSSRQKGIGGSGIVDDQPQEPDRFHKTLKKYFEEEGTYELRNYRALEESCGIPR